VRADTLPEARAAQLEAQRRLGPEGRFLTACQMSQSLRDLAMARIRRRHPNLDERGVRELLMRELYGLRADTE
jgi:hypothetical protein